MLLCARTFCSIFAWQRVFEYPRNVFTHRRTRFALFSSLVSLRFTTRAGRFDLFARLLLSLRLNSFNWKKCKALDRNVVITDRWIDLWKRRFNQSDVLLKISRWKIHGKTSISQTFYFILFFLREKDNFVATNVRRMTHQIILENDETT